MTQPKSMFARLLVAAQLALGAVGTASLEGGGALGQAIRVDEPFPLIALPSMDDGRPMSVADFRGRKTVLHVFASW